MDIPVRDLWGSISGEEATTKGVGCWFVLSIRWIGVGIFLIWAQSNVLRCGVVLPCVEQSTWCFSGCSAILRQPGVARPSSRGQGETSHVKNKWSCRCSFFFLFKVLYIRAGQRQRAGRSVATWTNNQPKFSSLLS